MSCSWPINNLNKKTGIDCVRFQIRKGITKNGFVRSKDVTIHCKCYKHVCVVCTVMLRIRLFADIIKKMSCEKVLATNLERRRMIICVLVKISVSMMKTKCGCTGMRIHRVNMWNYGRKVILSPQALTVVAFLRIRPCHLCYTSVFIKNGFCFTRYIVSQYIFLLPVSLITRSPGSYYTVSLLYRTIDYCFLVYFSLYHND
jgi:hypothetical protein